MNSNIHHSKVTIMSFGLVLGVSVLGASNSLEKKLD